MISSKIIYPLIFLCLILNSACSNGSDETVLSPAENLFYEALSTDQPDTDLLLACAEELISPWSGEALSLLSENLLQEPGHGEVKKINRLWKKYISQNGMDEKSLNLRQSLSLLEGGRSDDLLAPGELSDSIFLTLEKLTRKKTNDQSSIYDYLGHDRTELELDFLLLYLGEKGLMGVIDQAILDWISLKKYVYNKNYSQAYGVLSNLDRSSQVTGYGVYYKDSWRVLLSHPDRWRIIEGWESRHTLSEEKNRWESLFYAALCRRSLTSYHSASLFFQKAASEARTDLEYDRSLWYRLDCLDKSSDNLMDYFMESASLWKDPSFFDDLFNRGVSEMVFSGEWEKLNNLEQTINQYGSSHMKDRWGWIIARAGKRGFLDYTPEEETLLYEAIDSRNEGSWYTLLAQYVLSGRIRYFTTLPATSSQVKNPSLRESLSLREQIFWGFLERDMPGIAREWYEKYREDFSVPLLREYAYFLRRQGDYLESIRTMGYMGTRSEYQRSLEDLRLIYPLEFSGPIEYWCGEYGLSEFLFRALIKTESGYNNEIISYAGAVGLSQLMPATAQERLELMGISSADLTDPDINISLGTNYMAWLYEREYIENNVQATAAYNGGPGSVRKWNRTMGQYPEILYMEGIPFTQTRDYVQSLLQGAVIYGYLYGNVPPEETLRELLPKSFIEKGE